REGPRDPDRLHASSLSAVGRGADRVPAGGVPGAAGGKVTVARAGRFGADPEAVELPVAEMEPEPDRLARERGEIRRPLPGHLAERRIARDRRAGALRE